MARENPPLMNFHDFPIKKPLIVRGYPLVNSHNYGKSPFLMGKSTINCHFQ
jgi:hypothetical protein